MSNPFYLVGKGLKVLKNEGFASFKYRVKLYLERRNADKSLLYQEYIRFHEPDEDELSSQRESWKNLEYKPCFSVCVPLYRTKKIYLYELLDSFLAQTYGNFEVVLADAEEGCREDVSEYIKNHPSLNISYIPLEENLGISGNTNAAIDAAKGEVIVFCDHDDTIAPNSLYEFAVAMNEDGDIDVLYSDQDFLSADSLTRFEPYWKPDMSIDLLRCSNYICHLLAVKRDLLDKVGYLDPAYDGAQDYDLTLRLWEKAIKVHHVPLMLYHWRTIESSTAMNASAKSYAYEAGKRAVEDHYKRMNIPASLEFTLYSGKYRTVYNWPGEPLVSVLIPNKDHIEELKTCVDSIEELSKYRNFEIVIVENNSEKQESFDYYESLMAERKNVRVVYYEGSFNYSKINNFGVQHCNGDYILLLNNDTKLYDGELIGEMLGYIRREDVGAVGAKLFYEDETIQHAGVIIGLGGIAGHVFLGEHQHAVGNLGRLISVCNYSAVTAACLMTKKSAFLEVGGFTEELAVAFNDIDLCMKLREAGYLIVFSPFARAWHFESKSRGYEDTPEKIARFNGECAVFARRWEENLKKGDPFYNPNLTLEHSDFSEKREWEWDKNREELWEKYLKTGS